MSLKLRRTIAEKISEYLKPDIKNHYNLLTTIPNLLELRKSSENNLPELHLSAIKARYLFEKNDVKELEKIATEIKYDYQQICGISIKQTAKTSRAPTIIFQLNPDTFTKDALSSSSIQLPFNLNHKNKTKKIVVEFSSPNIAKPFHVGHLRSTIIGNFISNLYEFLGNNVIKLNYLGDWGTQFGLLQVGIEITGLTDEEICKNPIENLYKAYVTANQAAKTDDTITEQARNIFTQLEMGKLDLTKWELYRRFTVNELKGIYNRLGVEFDEYHWESQYSQQDIQNIIEILEAKKLLLDEFDGRKICEVGDRRVPIIKSDGSTLYLSRDIAALIDRSERYKFDQIFYVVDNAQTDHFNALFTIANGLNRNLVQKCSHIKFGRIKGMSTRQGNIVFLKDVLNEAKNVMLEKQMQSPTTKLDVNNLDNETADILGISAVIVNDLKQRRQRDYDFSWDKTIQVNGDTGIKLQYTHCRLTSLMQENSSINIAEVGNLKLLSEIEAQNLIMEISKFPETLLKAEESLEACVLVNYLFSLSNSTSRALKALNIKNEKNSDIQSQRLLLFETSRQILNKGMKILGLKPLEKM